MTTKFLVFGCGMQPQAIVYDLLTYNPEAEVTVCDADPEKVRALCARYAKDKARLRGVTLNVSASVHQAALLMKGVDVVVSALPYQFNERLTELAIASGASYVDLGGNIDVVKRQFDMTATAHKNGVRVVPDCGIAPGAVSIFAQYLIQKFGGMPDHVRIRVGGLPQDPTNPLAYAYAFNVHGLVNEYIEKVEVLEGGKLRLVGPMGGIEQVRMPSIDLPLEAAYTSGGSSTLARTYGDRIKELNYKTLRYVGHWQKIMDWHERGFFSSTHCAPHEVTPRDVAEEVLACALPAGRADLMAVRVSVGNAEREHRIEFVDRWDAELGHTAMMRTTGFSVAIVAQMLAEKGDTTGIVPQYELGTGTLRQEDLPCEEFVARWRARGLPYVEQKLRYKKRDQGKTA
jgi:lysine 6-dehydrogenase